RLRQELGAGHVRRQLDQLVLRSLADDVAVWSVGEDGDEVVHQVDVGRAEAAEADVDERSVAWRRLEVVFDTADTGVEPVPGRAERRRALVVSLGRVEGEVQVRRLVDELDPGQRRRTALLAERRELRVERLVQLVVAGPELVPA